MSANTTVYIKVTRTVTDIIEVSAITMQEAKEIASTHPGVIMVLDAAYYREELEPFYD
jgi:hypothetical protein